MLVDINGCEYLVEQLRYDFRDGTLQIVGTTKDAFGRRVEAPPVTVLVTDLADTYEQMGTSLAHECGQQGTMIASVLRGALGAGQS